MGNVGTLLAAPGELLFSTKVALIKNVSDYALRFCNDIVL
jgi:hypothetical protein